MKGAHSMVDPPQQTCRNKSHPFLTADSLENMLVQQVRRTQLVGSCMLMLHAHQWSHPSEKFGLNSAAPLTLKPCALSPVSLVAQHRASAAALLVWQTRCRRS